MDSRSEKMDINRLVALLTQMLPKIEILRDEPLKKYTTFRIGGPADVLVKPKTIDELSRVIQLCYQEKVPYFILGNGSNLLVSDAGYRGVIIQLYNQFADIRVEENIITAQAGALLSKIASKALENSLTGFEFAHGIPGTLGGAVMMNAGAYGGEMKQVLTSCTVMDETGKIITVSPEALELGYRTSSLEKNHWIVLEASLTLKAGEQEAISAQMKDYMQRRKDKQPLDKPSAGSTFKRPEGYFAGKLIMDSNLAGYQIGGAMVSDKHCGFVVNTGEATCKDVIDLIQHVKETVKANFGVELEPEVKRLGEIH